MIHDICCEPRDSFDPRANPVAAKPNKKKIHVKRESNERSKGRVEVDIEIGYRIYLEDDI